MSTATTVSTTIGSARYQAIGTGGGQKQDEPAGQNFAAVMRAAKPAGAHPTEGLHRARADEASARALAKDAETAEADAADIVTELADTTIDAADEKTVSKDPLDAENAALEEMAENEDTSVTFLETLWPRDAPAPAKGDMLAETPTVKADSDSTEPGKAAPSLSLLLLSPVATAAALEGQAGKDAAATIPGGQMDGASDGAKTATEANHAAAASADGQGAAESAPLASEPDRKPAPAGSGAPQPVGNPTNVMAPQNFRSELTMAAANYAIISGKSQATTNTGPLPLQTLSAEEADGTTQPVRIAVLPTRGAQSAPFLLANQLPLAAQATGEAPVASVAAMQSGQDKANAIDAVETKSARRQDAFASNMPARAGGEVALPVQAPVATSAAASTVVAAMAAEPSWRPSGVAALTHSAMTTVISEPKTLSIQLHPSELGVVTATLRLVGDQLTVEISAGTDEARSRLTTDSHAITKSLQALGFDIEQVTVVQPTMSSTPTARTEDGSALPSPTMRDPQQSGAGAQGGSGGRLGGQQAERNSNDGSSASRNPGTPAADGGHRGLYI